MVEENKEERWYFSREYLIANSPSRKHGYDADKELSCRQQAANLIQDMGQKLQVSQLCINTAIVYMHRFYVHHSLHAFPRNNIAAAALFLAAKVEEQPRKVEHVLKVAFVCLHREGQPNTLDLRSEEWAKCEGFQSEQAYLEQANELTLNESIILQTLGFEVAIDHPHTHVVRCCQLVKASKDLAQTSYFMASNSLHLTTMCLQYKPTVVACFCIHLACKWSNWEIPRSSENKDWFWYVNPNVTLDLLEQMTSEFLVIFDKCPTKLKRKMMSMNQINPLNFGVSYNAPPENYHFEEPRKLTGAEANRPPEGFAAMQRANERAQIYAQQPPQVAPAQQPAMSATQAPPNRHMDYKEYREKRERQERADRERIEREKIERERLERERAERERMERERMERERMERERILHRESMLQAQHGTGHSSHMAQKHLEKPKPPQSIQQQPNNRNNNSSLPKLYPMTSRPNVNVAAKEAPAQPLRPGKEALKRKLEEVDLTDSPPAVRQKIPTVGLPTYPEAQAKDHQKARTDEKYQNAPYSQQRQNVPAGRPVPTLPPKQPEVQKPDDLPSLMDFSDWHFKPTVDKYTGRGLSVPNNSRDPKMKNQQVNKEVQKPPLLTTPTERKTQEKFRPKYEVPFGMEEKKVVHKRIQEKKEKPPKTAKPRKIQPKEPVYDTELPSLTDMVEKRVEEKKRPEYFERKVIPQERKPEEKKIEKTFEVKPPQYERQKPFSIFSPEINDKPEDRQPYKKQQSSLFSPPPAPNRRLSTSSSERELVIPPKQESIFDEVKYQKYPKDPYQPQDVLYTSGVIQGPIINSGINSRHRSDAGAIIFPPADKSIFTSTYDTPPKSSPLSTVNLLNMGDMVDTRTNVAAVIKSLPPLRTELPKVEEKRHKSEKKKKDKDREGHRHKEKKSNKEKKKHKDKDKERKKEHRDRDQREAEKFKQESLDKSLRITIPKDKISESGIKFKIAKEWGAEETPAPSRPLVPETSRGLKITIKKDAIAKFKEEKKTSKKRDNGPHSSNPKPPKIASKPDIASQKMKNAASGLLKPPPKAS